MANHVLRLHPRLQPAHGGINAGLGDGSVRFVAASVNSLTWWIALVPNDGLPMPSDW